MNRSGAEQLGLTSKEAMARLAHDGYNELPSAKPRRLWAIAWDVVREPMFLLLIGASAIYLVLGDIREALVLFASVFVVMGIRAEAGSRSRRRRAGQGGRPCAGRRGTVQFQQSDGRRIAPYG